MPWSMILKIIDESIANGAGAFCPFLMQEPLLEPRLIPILRNIKMQNSRIVTTVYSNMSLMTEKKAYEILKAGVIDNLEVSFYAPNAETYEELQPPLKYETTFNNIVRFMRLKREGGYITPKVNLHYIAMPGLYEHAKRYIDEWKDIVDGVGFVHYDNWHGDQPDLENDAYWPVNPEKERFPCPRLWLGMQILSSGEVVPCCIDYEALEPMGNIRDFHLKEIWNNSRFQAMRSLHIERRFSEIQLCKDCTVWRYQHPVGWNQFWRQTKIPELAVAK
jgi:radical SAM protein with 4Fe4S-binding SPASM domain